MGLMRSLYAGVSGLRNHQVMMDVLGNNISNVNTIGFKSGRVSFSETFAQTLRGTTQPLSQTGGTNPIQVGLGMSIASIDTLYGQGHIETTGQTTDLAIQGDGFFIISDGNSRLYTRAGNFQFDATGTLISPGSGGRVQGYMANAEGKIEAGTRLTDITLPYGKKSRAKATSEVSLAGNLDASAIPKGNILETDPVYAVEDGDTDLNNLLAIGVLNDKVSGLVTNYTDVEVNYGGTTENYKYVSSDSAVGNGSFHSLNDLIAEINNDYSASGLTVSLTGDGALEFAGGDVLSLTSNNQLLEQALQSANGDLTAGNTNSDQFSHVANDDDLMVNLRDENGQSLQLAAGDEITINAMKGGDAITEHTFTITGATTYQDYATEVENALGLTNIKGVEIDAETGSMVVNADGGELYEITGLDIRADDTPGAGGTARSYFNDIFDSTPDNYEEIQKAEDVQQSATITVYDAQGNALDLSMIFTKDVTQSNRWKWEVQVPEPAVTTGGNTGYVEFNEDGSIKSFKMDNGASALQINSGIGGDNVISIDLQPGDLGGFDGLTQLASSSSSVLITSQDGYEMGTLERFEIDENGTITGAFSNGDVRTLGQIALSTFNNPGGLMRTENNLFNTSGNSGDPIISTAGEGINAMLISGALEQSNVDLADEFSKMIIAQRGFQANARIITTSDDMLTEVTNLKR